MNIEQVKEFFLYLWIVNLSVYIITIITLTLFKKQMIQMEKWFFNLEEAELEKLNAWYISLFKLLNILLAFSPWLALVIITH
jgi:uncharacterized membrane protein YhaH (DUF805 family)